ncbi:nickel pincer cofactor biosynthesis protein LarC [Synechococcus elongatus]|uniref:Putative nickel insertion protein n=1 Tax=Synechococcus elongatus PCC 11801 TaxID=2219813 RepID=A0AAN1QMV3_SYNEL|nr:nickel pincer cofactor biosynthesis protein LarC [Synechococcus elongatus]AZB72184.1 nickel pincer cofactor biosynthesis protein LarC [Synechococcus elongatus PCC 11801]
MTPIAYFDCPSGIAGNMCLGALVDAGVPLSYLEQQLQRLSLSEPYQLVATPVLRQGMAATHVEVQIEAAPHAHRHLSHIVALIEAAGLPDRVRDWSIAIFQQLAIAEAAVHGVTPEQVHFHEVGATDAIVDIVGTCLGLDYLGIEAVYCSALPTGGGTVKAAHGQLSVPVPAVLRLWQMRQVPVYSNGIERELVTPTGAAIAVTLAKSFGPPPPLQLQKTGWGAGSQDLPIPNLLKLWIGTASDLPGAPQHLEGSLETVQVLETQVDDCSPQVLAYVSEQLLTEGALEVFSQAITMKKGRLGTLLTVICRAEQQAACEAILFRETTTIGLRFRSEQRRVLPRRSDRIQTPWGEVRVKVAGDPQSPLTIQPEYEDCRAIAERHHVALQDVQAVARQQWQQENA